MEVDSPSGSDYLEAPTSPFTATMMLDGVQAPPTTSSPSMTAAAQHPVGIVNLNHDILSQIWMMLDDPANLYVSCKTMQAVGKDTWAIFYLISRSRLFNTTLFQKLLDRGALLPLCIVQEVAVRHFIYGETKAWLLANDKWSLALTSESVLAITSKGKALYGPDLGMDQPDTPLYHSWLKGYRHVTETQLNCLFEDHKYIPLPLRSTALCLDLQGGGPLRMMLNNLQTNIVPAILKRPSLARKFAEHDLRLTDKQRESLVSDHVLKDTSTQSIVQTLTGLLQQPELKDLLNEQIGSRILMNLKHTSGSNGSSYSTSHYIGARAEKSYEILKTLHRDGTLAWDLPSLVAKVSLGLSRVTNEAQRAYMLDRFSRDFGQQSASLGRNRWTSAFVQHQTASLNNPPPGAVKQTLEELHKAIQGFKPTVEDVMHILMNDMIVSDVFVLDYAKQYMTLDWDAVITRAIRLTLLQAAKGRLLSAIAEWAKRNTKIKVIALVEAEVKRHAIPRKFSRALPPETWRLTQSYASYHTEMNTWKTPPTWQGHVWTSLGAHADTRSIAGSLKWEGTSRERINKMTHYAPLDEGILPEVAAEVTISRSALPDPELSSLVEITYQLGRGHTKTDSLQYLQDHGAPLGPAIVQLCGPDSNAGRTAMDHVILSLPTVTPSRYNHSSSVAESVINQMADLGCRFALWHLHALERSKRHIPKRFISSIQKLDVCDLGGVDAEEAAKYRDSDKLISQQDLDAVHAQAISLKERSPFSSETDWQVTFKRDGPAMAVTLEAARRVSTPDKVWKYKPRKERSAEARATSAKEQREKQSQDSSQASSTPSKDSQAPKPEDKQPAEDADMATTDMTTTDMTTTDMTTTDMTTTSNDDASGSLRRSRRSTKTAVQYHQQREPSSTPPDDVIVEAIDSSDEPLIAIMGPQSIPVSLSRARYAEVLANAKTWLQHLRALLSVDKQQEEIQARITTSLAKTPFTPDDCHWNHQLRELIEFLKGEIERLRDAAGPGKAGKVIGVKRPRDSQGLAKDQAQAHHYRQRLLAELHEIHQDIKEKDGQAALDRVVEMAAWFTNAHKSELKGLKRYYRHLALYHRRQAFLKSGFYSRRRKVHVPDRLDDEDSEDENFVAPLEPSDSEGESTEEELPEPAAAKSSTAKGSKKRATKKRKVNEPEEASVKDDGQEEAEEEGEE